MRFDGSHFRALSFLLAIAIAIPELAIAQESPSESPQKTPTVEWSTQQQQAQQAAQRAAPQQTPAAGTVDPSAPPLAPSPQQTSDQIPTAPSATQQPSVKQGAQEAPSKRTSEPLGTAAAESVRTVGGGASRPAGTAIAPARQRQRRSLLIKIGALAAVGAAAGIVYGLTRATSSVPPNTR